MALPGQQFRTVIYNSAASGNLDRMKVFMDGKESDWIFECLNDTFNSQFPLVIAARNGHLHVVEYLLKAGADPGVRGTVEFDNDHIRGTPPLWAASAAGHLEIVKLLVLQAHANVNQTTETQSTPLRGACYDGHLEIVKFLLENGADVNIPNRHGHTSLMIAAYRNKISVVEYLLEHGAEVNYQTKKGNSALHDAAESGNSEIVEKLVAAGAKMSKDFQGVCPLLCAAQSGHPEIVEILLNQVSNNLLKRDAYKLLGCTLVDKKMDVSEAMSCWRKALEIRLTPEEEKTITEWETFTEPLEAYDNCTEIHRIWDFDRIEGNMDEIRMQSLLMRERILGGEHTDVHYYLRFRGAVYCDLGAMERCYILWKHALELQQKHFSPMHLGTVTTLNSFQETFVMTLNDYVNGHHDRGLRVNSQWVLYVFDKICFELERVLEWGDQPIMETECCGQDFCQHTTIDKEKKKLVVTALLLINLADRLSRQNDTDEKSLVLDVRRLVQICGKLHLPILHYSLSSSENEGADFMSLPNISVVTKLLDEGVDPTAMDQEGNSPIHILLASDDSRESIVRLLLGYGSLVLAGNKQGQIVLDILKSHRSRYRDIKIGKSITLASLAANAIRRKYQLKYEDVVPKDMLLFMLKH